MGREQGYKNLELGRGWNKGLGKKMICCVCDREFPRSQSKIRSRNAFCNPECKAKGMTLGLTASMRLGTGCDASIQYLKKKYYKYRNWDKQNGVSMPDYTVWDLVKRLKTGECYYCGHKETLGLDKIDNNGGHTRENTVVACELCNMTRGARFTKEEMREIGSIIRSIRERR